MPNISVRKLDEGVLQQLKIQAAHNGVSMEEEARQILTRGIMPQKKLGEAVRQLFSNVYDETACEDNGAEFQIPPREVHQPIEF
jgi:plasmid stability protein